MKKSLLSLIFALSIFSASKPFNDADVVVGLCAAGIGITAYGLHLDYTGQEDPRQVIKIAILPGLALILAGGLKLAMNLNT